MNITTIPEEFKILQRSSYTQMPRGGGSTEQGKYVRLYSSLTKNSANNYTLNVDISTSSAEVWNEYGVKIYSHVGGTSTHIGTITIYNGVPSSRRLSHTFTVSSTVSVYARCICLYCEAGYHSGHYWNFTNETSPDIAEYTVEVSKPYPSISWANSSSFVDTAGQDVVYRGTRIDDPNSMNYTDFSCSKPSGASSVTLYLDKYVNSSSWSNIQSGSSFRKTYSSSERGFLFRLRSLATSSSGATAWGDEVLWRINDLPTMSNAGITVGPSRTSDSVTASWGDLSDGLSNGTKKYRIHLNKWNGSNYDQFKSFDLDNEKKKTFNLSTYGFAPGDKCRLMIEPGDGLEWGYNGYGVTEITRNSAPYFTTGTTVTTNVDSATYNKTFKDSVVLSWNTAYDGQNDPLTYTVYYKAQNSNGAWSGDWTNIQTTSNRSVTVNCQNYVTKGKQIQFCVYANDGLANSTAIYSQVLTRASNPPAPTSLVINPSNSEEHYESITSISWTAATATSGNKCKKYKISMTVTSSKNVNDVISTTQYESDTTSLDVSINSVARGNYIIFKVKSVDEHGLESESTLDSKWCRRNRAPVSPKGFKVNSDKLNFYKTVPLKWDAASDPDGDSITYKITCSINGSGNYQEIKSGITTTTYSHDISNLKPKDTLAFKIYTIDKHNVSSAESVIENNNKITVNTKPSSLDLIYPIKAIYDNNPRILFETSGDDDKDNLNIKITCNGVTYNSATSQAFNKTSFSDNGDRIVFIPTVPLNEGLNVFTIKSFDGYEDSEEKTFNIYFSKPLLSPIAPTSSIVITNTIYNNFIKMINDSREAYGFQKYIAPIITPRETFIDANTFYKMYDNISSVNNWINSEYPGSNRNKTRPQINKGVKISKDIYNNILEIITNL